MKRLQAYSSNLVDYHLILDLMPSLARAYFSRHIPATLSYSQAAILLTLGLQCKTVDDIAQDLGLPVTQILALFSKSVRKLHSHLEAGKEAQIARKLPARKDLKATTASLKPYAVDLDEDLEQGAAEVHEKLKEYEKELGNLEQYAIKGSAEEVAQAAASAQLASGGLISVKVSKNADDTPAQKKSKKKRSSDHDDTKKTNGSSSSKKKKKQKKKH